MELTKIEHLIEKYLEAKTSIADENELRMYFSSPNVAQHLKQYSVIFGYYKQAKQEVHTAKIDLSFSKKYNKWLSIAAAAVVLFGVGIFYVTNKPQEVVVTDLGTFSNPEQALKETQKALAMLSNHVNVGIESVNYVTEYQKSKERIFN